MLGAMSIRDSRDFVSMRWPIRNQILVPFAVVQIAAVAVISAAAAITAARRAESETLGRMDDVVQTLSGSSFPLNQFVLDKLRGLSGAHFAVIDGKSVRATTVASPLPPGVLPDVQNHRSHLTLDPSHTCQIGNERFLVGRVGVGGNIGPVSLLVLYPETQWNTIRRDAVMPPLVIGGCTLLVMVIVSVWLASRMGRRMRTIEDQVSRVADGDFEQIQLEPCNDEIRDLSASVNRMSAAMSRMLSTIRDNERASLITQFAGGLAHQLRNAVTGARMAVQVHRRRCGTEDRESLDVALSQLSLTEAQVSGLLRLTRDERRMPVPGDVSQIVGNVATLVRPTCEHAQVILETQTRILPGVSVGDADGLQAALLNLVLNAIEAAGPSGLVRVHADVSDGNAVIKVSDNGAGIEDAVAESLFDPFVTTKPEGVGLGLALAMQAARDHNGSLTHRRESDRTVFTLIIRPLTEAPESQALNINLPAGKVRTNGNEPRIGRR